MKEEFPLDTHSPPETSIFPTKEYSFVVRDHKEVKENREVKMSERHFFNEM